MLVNLSYWYIAGVLFFISHTVLYRPAFARSAPCWLACLAAFCSPVAYTWAFVLDIRDDRTRWKSVIFSACVIVVLASAVSLEVHIRAHAAEHTQMRLRADRLLKEEDCGFILPSSDVEDYIYHVSPFYEDRLPFTHRIEHKLIRFIESFNAYDIDLDGVVDDDRIPYYSGFLNH